MQRAKTQASSGEVKVAGALEKVGFRGLGFYKGLNNYLYCFGGFLIKSYWHQNPILIVKAPISGFWYGFLKSCRVSLGFIGFCFTRFVKVL